MRAFARMARAAYVAGCAVALCCGIVSSTRAGDITHEQIEQLQKARHDAQATRDSL